MIIIPMAGLSSRFFKAGYVKPKYMLQAYGETLFTHAVKSFKKYFHTEEFLFIIQNDDKTYNFIKKEIKALNIKNIHICMLNDKTRGQAETVALGIQETAYQGPLTIFNIDTFRPNFIYPNLSQMGGGYLEVFIGEGNHWSFVKPYNNITKEVAKTSEKRPISNLCCTGLYYFSQSKDYLFAYSKYSARPQQEWEGSELYVAPLYNELITKGIKIYYHLIKREEVIFCGTPSEFEAFVKPVLHK